MQHGLKLRNYKITKLQNRQRGYMMITLMLAFALITIAMLAVLPAIKQQIQRDREDELRHRGTAYMRAIQHFYRKFGRYPTRIEELENTNNLRFLRKRYTDPMNRDPATGKERDFKLLHQTDVPLGAGLGLGQLPGQAGLPGQGLPGGAQGQLNAANAGAVLGALQQATAGGAQPVAMGGSGNPASGNSPDTEGNSDTQGSTSSGSSSGSGLGFNGPTFGGGPILGVASLSKEKPIRVFNGKTHYKDWLFIYVPQADQGGLLVGPMQLGVTAGNFGGAAPGMSGGPQGQGAAPNSGQPQGFSPQPQQSPAPSSPQQ
jgi:type II secretory pathway pseudopilin PulG